MRAHLCASTQVKAGVSLKAPEVLDLALLLLFGGIRGDQTLCKRYPNLPTGPNQQTHSRSSCGTIDLAICWFNRSGCLLKGDWEGLL